MRTPVKPKYMYETNININAGLTPQIPRTVYEYYRVYPFFLTFFFFSQSTEGKSSSKHLSYKTYQMESKNNWKFIRYSTAGFLRKC